MIRSDFEHRASTTVQMGQQRRRMAAAVKPLDPTENARARQIAARLRSALQSLVDGIPEHARGASVMSRHLGVTRNACQRVVTVLAQPSTTPALLARMPGVQGLRLLVDGFRGRGADAADVAAAESAIERFEEFIRDAAGSHSKLVRRLSTASTAPKSGQEEVADRSPLTARQHLFAAASEVMGRHCESQVTIYAYRLDPTDDTRLERAMLTGDFGQVSTPWAMPRAVVLGNVKFQEPEKGSRSYESLDHTPAHGHTQHSLLEEFCSKPLPVVTSRGTERRLVQAIDQRSTGNQPIDFVVANRSVHAATLPGTNDSALEGVWKLVNYPTRHLVFDVFLHRDMERLYRPGIDVQLWGPNLDIPPADRWLKRFPDVPRLQLLGTGIGHAHTHVFPRYVELASTFFRRLAWSPDDFVGFRCEVDYPIWRGGYFMTFEESD
jgi:hypothetical protein